MRREREIRKFIGIWFYKTLLEEQRFVFAASTTSTSPFYDPPPDFLGFLSQTAMVGNDTICPPNITVQGCLSCDVSVAIAGLHGFALAGNAKCQRSHRVLLGVLPLCSLGLLSERAPFVSIQPHWNYGCYVDRINAPAPTFTYTTISRLADLFSHGDVVWTGGRGVVVKLLLLGD